MDKVKVKTTSAKIRIQRKSWFANWVCRRCCFLRPHIIDCSIPQARDCVEKDVIYFENNNEYKGKIIKYSKKRKLVKHVIKLANDEKISLSLKAAVERNQVVIIEKEYELTNIQYINNYLPLYLSSESPRNKCWKPTVYNDTTTGTKMPYYKRDPMQFHGTERSTRPDWMLQQKFAYGDCVNDEWQGFLRMMIGGCYELNDNHFICVKDVVCTRGTQIIFYFYIHKLSVLFIYNTLYIYIFIPHFRPSEISDIIINEEEISSKYNNLSRKDNIVIPIVDVIHDQKVSLFKIKRYVSCCVFKINCF